MANQIRLGLLSAERPCNRCSIQLYFSLLVDKMKICDKNNNDNSNNSNTYPTNVDFHQKVNQCPQAEV